VRTEGDADEVRPILVDLILPQVCHKLTSRYVWHGIVRDEEIKVTLPLTKSISKLWVQRVALLYGQECFFLPIGWLPHWSVCFPLLLNG
jgi:hypothetical protein